MSFVRRATAALVALVVAPVLSAQLAASPLLAVPSPFEPSADDPARPVALFVTAHPDDEDNALGALMRFRYGVRAVLWTMTRGEGGQNEIGLEQGEALKLLRDAELEAAHRFDGFEQFYPARRGLAATRLEYPDFGYSFSVAETLARWTPERPGRGVCREVLQAVRPHVVVLMSPEGDGGGQHHQTSAQLMIEECALERNPWREDGRARDGAAWHRPFKVYAADPSNWTPPGASRPASRPASGPVASRPVETVDVDVPVDEPAGPRRTYRDLAAEARSMHKSQGMSRTLEPIGPPTRRYRLLLDRTETERGPADASSATTAPRSASEGAVPPRDAFDAPLFGGVRRALGRTRGDAPAPNPATPPAPSLVAYADLDRVVAGETLQITVELGPDAEPAADGVPRRRVERAAWCAAANGAEIVLAESRPSDDGRRTTRFALRAEIPATVDDAARSGEPFFVRCEISDALGRRERVARVLHRTAGDVFSGEQRDPVVVVPPWDVRVEPPTVIVPRSAVGTGRSVPIRVHVRRNAATPAAGEVGIVGEGLRVDFDAPTFAPLARGEEFVAAGRLFVHAERPGAAHATLREIPGEDPGATRAEARAALTWRRVVDYPHVERRFLTLPASASVRVIEVEPPPPSRVGYVRGVGEESERWLAQLGADVAALDADALAVGDLNRCDVIVIGARAYEFRPELVAHRRRLRAFMERGGVVVCQYQKTGLAAEAFAPFPARIGAGRTTDEAGPVVVLAPEHPLFTTPNRIGDDDWRGWTRDRSLYHLELAGAEPGRYVDLAEFRDTYGSNAGPRPGALVEARVGRGRWIYCAAALWRQLPEGVPGAWRLWANLLALRGS